MLVKLKLGDIFKSSDFGGGKGSGGGAEETERNESAQCLYAALIFYIYKKQTKTNKVVSKKDFTNDLFSLRLINFFICSLYFVLFSPKIIN